MILILINLYYTCSLHLCVSCYASDFIQFVYEIDLTCSSVAYYVLLLSINTSNLGLQYKTDKIYGDTGNITPSIYIYFKIN